MRKIKINIIKGGVRICNVIEGGSAVEIAFQGQIISAESII